MVDMTREEAKEILEEVKTIDDSMYQYSEKYLQALDMAIKALEQERSRSAEITQYRHDCEKLMEENERLKKALEQEPCEDCISRESAIDYFRHWYSELLLTQKEEVDFCDILRDMSSVQPKTEQEPKFIAKADGTIEQIKDCNDCLFKNEWQKIGKAISVILEKQTEQEPKTGHWIVKIWDNREHYACSECKHIVDHKPCYHYCPYCGCRMESEVTTT